MNYQSTEAFAEKMDREDALSRFRSEFLFPEGPEGKPALYFAGNSLGLQPRKTKQYINEELEDWAKFGVEGHLSARHPWLPYHEFVTEPMARVVGAQASEVVVMNTLTTNLHLMMVSFYRPTSTRRKILMEKSAFPSDQYAIASQVKWHGYDPNEAILEIAPRAGEDVIRPEDILETIQREGDKIALVLLGNVNYLTGQAFDTAGITRAAQARGCKVGFDFAHGAGNLELRLHDWGVDFAVWCNYKYLNSGPGALAGCFIHERHLKDKKISRFEGWWGHDKATRFQMPPKFAPIPTAEAWQLSNPPIFQLAAIRASLEIFDQATMRDLRAKSEKLTGYLESQLKLLPSDFAQQVTPVAPDQRGAQISLRIKKEPKKFVEALSHQGVIADFREPDIARFSPAPLYNSYKDVYQLFQILNRYAKT